LALLTALGAGMVAQSGPAGATVSTVKGSAFGYQLNVSLFGGPINTRGVGQVVCTNPPTNNLPAGCVPDTQAAAASSPLVTLPAGGSGGTAVTATKATTSGFVGPAEFFSSGQVDVSTNGTTGVGGSVTSKTITINNVDRNGSENFGYGPLDTFGTHPKNPSGLTTNVSSTCTASETGNTGSTTITYGMLELDGGWDDNENGNYNDPGDHPPVRITVPTTPAKNTTYTGHLHVNGVEETWTYVFNKHVTNTDGSLTVYAGHQTIHGPTAVGSLYFGKSECGVKRTTTTALASSANPSTVGQSVTFTATVARQHGTGTPTGTVQFKVDGVNSGTPVTLVGGQATKALSNLTAGSHTITAVYAGKLAYLGSTGTLTQQVN